MADRNLANTKFSLQSAMNLLRNLKAGIFPNAAVVQEATKRLKEVTKLMNVDFPKLLVCGQKKPGIKDYHMSTKRHYGYTQINVKTSAGFIFRGWEWGLCFMY